jgi:hypothetical protein
MLGAARASVCNKHLHAWQRAGFAHLVLGKRVIPDLSAIENLG